MIWGWLTAAGTALAAGWAAWRWRSAVARADKAEKAEAEARKNLTDCMDARKLDHARATAELATAQAQIAGLLRDLEACKDPAAVVARWNARVRK